MKVKKSFLSALDKETRLPSNSGTFDLIDKVLRSLGDAGELKGDAVSDREKSYLRCDGLNTSSLTLAAFLRDGRPFVLWFTVLNCSIAVESSVKDLLRRLQSDGHAKGGWLANVKDFLENPTQERDVIICFAHARPLDSLQETVGSAVYAAELGVNLSKVSVDFESTFFDPISIFEAVGVQVQLCGKKAPSGHHIRRIRRNFHSEDREIFRAVFGELTPNASHIFLTVEAEKRIWKEQDEAVPQLLSRIRSNVGTPLTVIVNGMTSPFGGSPPDKFESIFQFETDIVDRIRARSPADTSFVRAFGLTIRQKLALARTCAFSIGPVGSGSIVPIILGMPGISYHNTYFLDTYLPIDPVGVMRIDESNIVNCADAIGIDPKFGSKQTTGYSIDTNYFVEVASQHFGKVAMGAT